jgi:hypothetical protein
MSDAMNVVRNDGVHKQAIWYQANASPDYDGRAYD